MHPGGGRRLPARHLEFCRDGRAVADRGYVRSYRWWHDRILRNQLNLRSTL